MTGRERLGPGRGRGYSGARGGPLRSQTWSAGAGGPLGVMAGGSRAMRLVWNVGSTVLFGLYLWIQLGWMVAVAVLFGIIVHELGHVLTMNALGCGPARMHIVPFFGGLAIPARAAESEFEGVLISLAGPVFGLLAAAPFVALAVALGDPIWVIEALAVATMNLINLAPAPPLDGSHALGPSLARVHPMLERAALVAVGAIAILWALSTSNFIFGLFIGFGVYSALRRRHLRALARRLTRSEWLKALALYAGAAAACVGVAWASLASVGIHPGVAGVLALLRLA